MDVNRDDEVLVEVVNVLDHPAALVPGDSHDGLNFVAAADGDDETVAFMSVPCICSDDEAAPS